ncbi:MAG: elongation factor Ts [Candidatus Nealsonbacteria bacterium]|nr:elongation factor Ts [Candidatus Nealsonbacteria bacterium]
MISIEQIKQLREETDVSVTECKKALEQAKGDLGKAKEILRKMGRDLAGKITEKEAKQGIVHSYIHSNKKIGVLLEIRCQTDFVAKSQDFQKLANELCLQIAAMKPLFIKEQDINEELLSVERKIFQEQITDKRKPQDVIDKIVAGKLERYKKEICLMSQPWIKDGKKIVKDLIDEYIAKFGENIVVRRFARHEI